jgi:uncharacterized protein
MQKQKAEVGKVYRTALVPHLRSIDEEARTIEFVSSTEKVDRYGDIIRVAGWKLDAYRKNPVFLWAHRSGEPPIGRCVDCKTEANPPALVQKIQFADKQTYEFADTIFNLYKGGFLNAVSVGFMPLEMPKRIADQEGNGDGYEFTSQELLELSAVPVPANADCLARAVSKGFAAEDLRRVFAPASAEAFYRELISIYAGIADCAVLVAKQALAALKAAGVVREGGDITVEELLAAIREGVPDSTGDSTEITTLEELAQAVGTADLEPSLEEVFSDSRSLRTGKFKFALRPELR